MASENGLPNTTSGTTTTTNTTTTVTHDRYPRSSSHNNNSSTSSRNPILIVNQDEEPQVGAGDAAEPFPGLPIEPVASSNLAPVRTRDFQNLSPAVTRASQRTPATNFVANPRRRTIGIKRLASQSFLPNITKTTTVDEEALPSTGRRRSTSAPQRPFLETVGQDGAPLRHAKTASNDLSAVIEGQESGAPGRPDTQNYELQDQSGRPDTATGSRRGNRRLRAVSDATRSIASRLSNRSEDTPHAPQDEYNDDIIDVLDVLDPEVSTLTTLTNVQNSLFVPDLGRWLNRRPTFELTKGPSYSSHRAKRPISAARRLKPLPPTPTPEPVPPKDIDLNIPSDIDEETEGSINRDRRGSLVSISSSIREDHYAVLPHGVSLNGWSEEDKELLDDHVRHMLHSRREGFKRSMRAFGKYVKNPLGFFVTLYAFLITIFGLVWVLFLIGWISAGEKQSYDINVIDNVLVALFAVVGDGLAPFRAVDTYHMGFIAYYHHLTEKLRKKRDLPKLPDQNDLPEKHEADVEASVKDAGAEFSVLTPEQQRKLEHHQNKFSKSHSFYKPHETNTHYAFPHHLFVAIVILLDLHSCLQIALGSCTWGISYHTRPKALTPTILSCSITVNITAGILIKVGDNKTRKKDVLTRMFRQELTEEAIRRVHKDKSRDKYGSKHMTKEEIENDMIREESETGSNSGVEQRPADQHLKV